MRIDWLTAFIDRPADRFDAAVAFWLRATGSALSARRGESGQFATLLPATGDGYVRVQRVDGGPGGSHLDLHTADLAATARRAVRLGAEVLLTEDDVVVLRSPAGLPHCSVGDSGERRRPAPVPAPGGRTLLDQICVDIPPAAFDREVDYWRELTGWAVSPAGDEFVRLEVPESLPLRILLQRQDEPGPDAQAAAHLDFASDDADAAAARHETLGATIIGRYPGWLQLADPAGAPYCITRRPVPDS
jgi:Glyoxalase-like domain